MEFVQYFTGMEFPPKVTGYTLGIPQCALSLASAGSLKPKEHSMHRNKFFSSIGINPHVVVSVSQTHSQIVHIAKTAEDFTSLPEGDGIITINSALVPCVTVADCMPVYLFNPLIGCFGVLHSGWKGTGIIASALERAKKEWGAKASDFQILFGPHIHSCCYTVDIERSEYFAQNFGENSVCTDPVRSKEKSQWPFRLSLVKANTNLCLSLGIPSSHIHDSGFCTACNPLYGSNRRQGSGNFTQMAAFMTLSS